MSGVPVSVVVPTRNSARTLERCLRSIREQAAVEIELLVVDNDSHDATVAIARRYADTLLRAGPERSAQRNAGARAACGEYLLFVDSDMLLEPGVVGDCLRVGNAADVVVIPETSFGHGFWARCRALERSCYAGDDTVEAGRFFPRELFESCGGYDESLSAGEDWDLHARCLDAGARVARVHAAIHHDEGDLRLRGQLAKKFYYGRELRRYRAKQPDRARAQLRLLRPAYIRHRRRLVREPVALVGMSLMKLAEALAGAAGYALAELQERYGR